MSAGGTFKNIAVLISGTDNLTPVLARAGAQADNFAKKMSTTASATKAASDSSDGLGKSLSSTSKAIATGLGLGAVTVGVVELTRAFKDTIDQATEFQTAMQNVQSISFLSDSAIGSLSKSVIALSKTLPTSATSLADALYPIASHGFTGAAALDVLTASAKAASAGLSDTETAATIIGSILNAYGESADQATAASDALLATTQHGVLTFSTLAGTLSQVIGIASTAGVSINEVGAAIDTMTRAGVTGDQAGVELNRVIDELIDPTKGLADVYKELGYQSGAAALQTEGLHGVMEDLQRVTGGNVNNMLDLFQDIRAARGAMALMSDQGQLYNGIYAQVGNATETTGATMLSLAEQSKSASFQFSLFKNEIDAGMIEIGQKSLPYLVDFAHGIEHAASDSIPLAKTAARDLTPVVQNLESAFASTGHAIGGLVTEVRPLATVLAELAGVAVVGSLQGLAKSLEATTGFLAEHKTVVYALALAYTGSLLPALIRTGVELGETAYLKLLLAVDSLKSGVTGLGGALDTLVSPAGIVSIGLVLLANEFISLESDIASAKKEASSFTQGINADDLSAQRGALSDLGAAYDSAAAREKAFNTGGGGTIEGAAQLISPFNKDTVVQTKELATQLANQYNATAQNIANVTGNAHAAASALGLIPKFAEGGSVDKVVDQFAALAQSTGIDLSKPLSASQKQIASLVAAYKGAADGSQGLAAQMASNGQVDVDSLVAIDTAIQNAGKAADTAFGNQTDVLGSFSLKATAQDLKTATKANTTAQKDLASAKKSADQDEARYSSTRKKTLAETQSLSNAQDKLTTATQNAATAKEALDTAAAAAADPAGQYTDFLHTQLQQAQDFVTGIQNATAKGLSATSVAALLAAGPKQAAPALEAIAADHSGNLIKLVNQTEATLSTLNEQTVEDARLTQAAIQSSTDDMSKDLAKAMSVDNLEISSNGKDTAGQIAKALGIAPDDATRIAKEFGITLATSITASVGPALAQSLSSVYASQVPTFTFLPVAKGQRTKGFAGGGIMSGPGTGTSDSIITRVSTGEGIVKAASVARYGPAMIHALNAGSYPLPRFAMGGIVGGGQSVTTSTHIGAQIDMKGATIVTPDAGKFARQMQRKAQLSSLSGGRVRG